MPGGRCRRSVVTRFVACLVVAGLTMSAVLSLLEWRRTESRLRVDIAQAAHHAAHDLASVLRLVTAAAPGRDAVIDELLRLRIGSPPIVGARFVPFGKPPIERGYWPDAHVEAQQMILLDGGVFSAEAVPLDRPLIITRPTTGGHVGLVVDGPGALAQKRAQLLERLAVQWLIVASLTLLALLLIRRWVGEPLADLSGLIRASANADTLDALARTQSGDVGRLAASMVALLRQLEDQHRELARRERAFADLFERAPAAMVSFDPSGIITQANTAAAALMDESGVPLERRGIADLVQVEDRPMIGEVIARLRHDDTARCRLRLRAGLQRPATEVAIEAVAVRNTDGDLESIRLSVADVSGAVKVRDRLLERAEALRIALDHVPDALLMVDEAGRVVVANRRMLTLLRRERVEQNARLDEAAFWDGLNLADAPGWAERVRKVALQPDRTVQEQLATLDGALLVRSSPVNLGEGVRGRLWLLQDASHEEQRDRAKDRQKRRVRALRAVGDALAEVRDVDGLLEQCLAELRPILGVDAAGIAVRGQHAAQRTKQLIHPGQGSILLTSGRALAHAVERDLFPRIMQHADLLHWPDLDAAEASWAGGFRSAGLTALSASPLAGGRQLHGVVWVAQRGGLPLAHEALDLLETLSPLVAARLQAAQVDERLQGLHLVDPVTELPSVLQFDRAMHTLLGRAGEPAALVVLDLDEFETLNRDHGRAAGDAALRQIAGRLLASNRRTCFVARFAGPAFGVVVTDADRDQAIRVAERLRGVIAETDLRLPGGTTTRLTASIGVAAWPHDGLRVDELLDLALVRIRAAKLAGRNRVVADSPAALAQAG